MINLENPRFTERTTINLRRSHCLPHICIIIIYGKFGGTLAGNYYMFIYIIHRNQRVIWLLLIWILKNYNDVILKTGIANLGRSHYLPYDFNNFHQFP
jgi:hypothetical protein